MSAYERTQDIFNPKNNSLSVIRNAWTYLLHRPDVPIEIRMTKCYEQLDRFGKSAVQELLGFYDPEKCTPDRTQTPARVFDS